MEYLCSHPLRSLPWACRWAAAVRCHVSATHPRLLTHRPRRAGPTSGRMHEPDPRAVRENLWEGSASMSSALSHPGHEKHGRRDSQVRLAWVREVCVCPWGESHSPRVGPAKGDASVGALLWDREVSTSKSQRAQGAQVAISCVRES